MSSYLLDVVCLVHSFLGMGWKMQPSDPPIHVYFQDLWKHKYRIHYHNICEHFMTPLFHLLLYSLALCMLEKPTQAISKVGDWYVLEKGIYIRFYGATKAPHLLPKFIPDKLVL
jgi:hypothetical protein